MPARTKLSGKDLLLLLLYAPGLTANTCEGISGRTRLMKMVFLFKEEIYPSVSFDKSIDFEKLPSFYSWSYGPFSRDVYSDLEFFVDIGFVEARSSEEAETPAAEAAEYSLWESELGLEDLAVSEHTQEKVELTEKGKGYVEYSGLWCGLSERQQDALAEFKKRLVGIPLYAILKYVYEKYPEYTEKSKIKDTVISAKH